MSRSTANSWLCGTARWHHSTICSSGSTARPRPRNCCAIFRRQCGSTTCCARGRKICAASAFIERRLRLEAWYARAPRTALDLSPMVPFTSWGELGELRDGARRARHRGADAEAGGFALRLRPAEGSVVQMEARRADPRHRADVCPARPRQALVVLFRLHVRRLARRTSWCRSARPIPASPTRNCAASTNGCATIPSSAAGRCARSRRSIVLEVAFDSVHRSTRHKSGVAMRFPRIHRIRWDKPFREADTLETLERMMT